MLRAVQDRHPPFKQAVLADLALARRQRGDRRTLTSRAALAFEVLRVIWLSDAFGALVLYRLKAACQRRRGQDIAMTALLSRAWDGSITHPSAI